MLIEYVELVRVRLPVVAPFRTSYGIEAMGDVLLVHVVAGGVDGWGEDVALREPVYDAEFLAASHLALRDHLLPWLLEEPELTAAEVGSRLARFRGWSMAACAVEAAVLDAECRAEGISLRDRLGGTRSHVPVGVAVGLHGHILDTVVEARARVAEGYRRVKLKIEPGRDVEVVAAVRDAVGPDVALQVDANGAYSLEDADHLARLDDFDLLFVEQPLPREDLAGHAALARRLATPVCLDESITSARAAAAAIEAGACRVVCVKPGRVGGFLEAVRIHDLCRAAGIRAWVGGMFECGVGRAANLALATLPGFDLLPDLSASNRYFETDVTEPFVLRDGGLDVPAGPGIGVTPLPELLDRFAEAIEVHHP